MKALSSTILGLGFVIALMLMSGYAAGRSQVPLADASAPTPADTRAALIVRSWEDEIGRIVGECKFNGLALSCPF
jgi:hypothetical protein